MRAFGTCVVNGKESTEPLAANATFRLGSCTALMTTIAVLQCVERGLLRLDEDVTQILPELKDIDVLTGFDPRTNRPILVRRRNTLTLRFVNPRILFHLAPFNEQPLVSYFAELTFWIATFSRIPRVLPTTNFLHFFADTSSHSPVSYPPPPAVK